MSRTALGLSLNGLEFTSAAWQPETPAEQMATARWLLPGQSVVAEPPATPLLSGVLRSAREVRPGRVAWLAEILRTLGQRWLPDVPKPLGRTVFALPGEATPAVAAECCDVARQAGWPESVVAVPQAAALARYHLGGSAKAVTALLWLVEFDALEIAVVTVLKTTVRLRARLRLRCFSHAVSDEVLLAAFRSRLGLSALWSCPELATLWPTARKMRQQLETGVAGAVEIEANHGLLPGVGVLSLTRDEIWPHLRPDLETAIDASTALLDRLQIPRRGVAQILFAGKGALAWRECVDLLHLRFGCPVQSCADSVIAVGAAQLAGDPDVQFGTLDFLDPAWVQAWETRPSQARARSITVRAAPAPKTLAPPAPPETAANPEDALWAYLRGLAQGNPVLARERLQHLVQRAQGMLDELVIKPAENRAAVSSPTLALADEAIQAGRLERAVELSHLASESAPDDPTVFRRMIQLHVAAAERTARHEQALQWLLCAYHHDSSDKQIHRLLAQHYRGQAQAFAQAGNHAAALQAGEQSLNYEPFHDETQRAVSQWRRSLEG